MSGQWGYVIAAYAVTAIGTVAVLWQSWHAMRQTEQRVANLNDRENDPTP